MAAVNVDANLINRSMENDSKSGEVCVKEKVVQMQNGCYLLYTPAQSAH